MKTNPLKNLKVGRAVLRAPQATGSMNGARGVTGATCLALLAATAFFTQGAFAGKPPPPPPPSSGTLVLDYYSGGNGSENFGMTAASSGTVFSCGTSYFPAYGGAWHGILLASANAGANWTTLLDDSPPGFSVGFGGIAGDAAGNLYVAGLSYDYTFTDPYDHGIVLRSADGGITWTMVDDFGTGQDSGDPPTGITVDAAGDVYVSEVTTVSGTSTWTIRKGVGDTSFSTVDAVAAGHAQGIYAHPTAGVFAVGTKTVSVVKGGRISIAAWLVRRSTNGGKTWSDVDAFQLSAGNSAHANEIGADSLGNLYVVGRGTTTSQGNNIYHWVVRRSTDGGNSWSTVDDFVPSSNSAEARGVAATPNGDLYVVGIASSSTGNHWIVRKNSSGTGTWSTIDDYQYVAGANTEPRSIVADASGNLFIGGFGWGPSGSGTHWLIKKY